MVKTVQIISLISSVSCVKRALDLSELPTAMLPSFLGYLSASEQRQASLTAKSFDEAFKIARSAYFDALLAAESGPFDVVELGHKDSLELLHSPAIQRRLMRKFRTLPIALSVEASDVAALDANARAFLARVHTLTSETDFSVAMYRLPQVVRRESPTSHWYHQEVTLAKYLSTYVRSLETKFPTHRYLPVHVDLSGADLGQVDLGLFRNVYILTLVGCFNVEPSELIKLTNVRILTLGRNEELSWATAVQMTAGAPNLIGTGALPTSLTSLEPVERFMRLRALRLRNLPISDLTPIADLTQLRDLVFVNTQVSDLRPLRGLLNLRRLSLSRSPVHSLAGLETLTGLEFLDLSRTRVADLTPILGHRRLDTLDITGTPVSDLMPLVDLPKLRFVVASYTRVTAEGVAAFQAEVARRGREVFVDF